MCCAADMTRQVCGFTSLFCFRWSDIFEEITAMSVFCFVHVAEMHILRRIFGVIRNYRIRKEYRRENLQGHAIGKKPKKKKKVISI